MPRYRAFALVVRDTEVNKGGDENGPADGRKFKKHRGTSHPAVRPR
jgi:hypothetical protein